MTGSEVLTIGSTIKHRGEYNSSTTYYFNNQVTMYGCVFQALSNNFSNMPPLTITSDQTIKLANTAIWKCIINNVELYNATLSTNNLDNRVTTIEGNINSLKSTAEAANKTAQEANTKATSALTIAQEAKQNTTNLKQLVDQNKQSITKNTIAIKALQNKTSALEIVCNTKIIAYEPDDDGNMDIKIPMYVYQNGTNITEKAKVSAQLYTPVQTGIAVTWADGKAAASISNPGKYELIVNAENEGVATEQTFYFYMTLPIYVTQKTEDLQIKLAQITAIELPITLSVSATGHNAAKLLFNIPSYLNAKQISSCGINVPIANDGEEKDNYDTISTVEEIVPGTYDFSIQ